MLFVKMKYLSFVRQKNLCQTQANVQPKSLKNNESSPDKTLRKRCKTSASSPDEYKALCKKSSSQRLSVCAVAAIELLSPG